MAMDFNMKIIDGFDFVVEEKNNTFMALRILQWSDTGTPRLDLRKYHINSDGDEVIGKGVGFATEEGPHELVKIMIENDYGKTDEILSAVKDRDDFVSSLNKVLSPDQMKEFDLEMSDEEEDVYYDPRELV